MHHTTRVAFDLKRLGVLENVGKADKNSVFSYGKADKDDPDEVFNPF